MEELNAYRSIRDCWDGLTGHGYCYVFSPRIPLWRVSVVFVNIKNKIVSFIPRKEEEEGEEKPSQVR